MPGPRISPVDPGSRATNRGLEFLRGGAALLVLVSHCRLYPYLVAGQEPSGRNLGEKLLLVPASFGREAVAVFFVLSGYLVGGQVLAQLGRGSFSPRAFAIRRVSRFAAVLVPGLVFTAALDAVSRATLTSPSPEFQGGGRSSAGDFLCNVALLMDSRCQTFGTNDSLWSLGYEFWFYLLFAAGAVAVVAARRGRARGTAVAGVVAVGCVLVYGPVLLSLIPAWLIGAATAHARNRPSVVSAILRTPRRLLGAAIATFVVGLVVTQPLTELPLKYAVLGLTTWPLVLCLAVLRVEPGRAAAPFERFGVWLGLWSFTLYVFHLPVVMFTMLVAARLDLPVNPLSVYVQAAVVLLLVRPAYWLGERHTVSLRAWMERRLPEPRATRVPGGSAT